MNVDAEVAALEKQRKILTRWGAWGTALYVGAILGYCVRDFAEFAKLVPNEVGDFLSGAFAPLAFLWLVLGYRMQALELEQNSKALRQQAEEMRGAVEQATRQAEAASENADLAKENVFIQSRLLYERDLANIALSLWVSLERPGGDFIQARWDRFKNGEFDAFSKLLVIFFDSDDRIAWFHDMDKIDEFNENLRSYISLYDNFMMWLASHPYKRHLLDYYSRSSIYLLRAKICDFASRHPELVSLEGL